MRKWLFVLLFIAVLYAVSRIGVKKPGKRSTTFKQISEALTIAVWGLLVAYVIAFLYWLYTIIFK
jgi:uncharacterized BrkB/YihY/UPF0761 family membrane protein